MHVCGIILSGGKSSRMGTNKSLLVIDRKKVIEHIVKEIQTCSDEVIIITNEPPVYTFLDLRLFPDRYINKGPLAGLETALYNVDADVFMIAACDMPFISRRVYRYLLGQLDHYDAVVPVYENQIHPLSGIYKKSVSPYIQQQLEKDELKVTSFFEHINVKYVSDFDSIPKELLVKHFFNMNNRTQYEQAKRL